MSERVVIKMKRELSSIMFKLSILFLIAFLLTLSLVFRGSMYLTRRITKAVKATTYSLLRLVTVRKYEKNSN